VCLVDANLRDPFLHRHFSVGNSIGFSDVLSGTHAAASVAVPVASKLWLVPAGLRRPRQAPVQDGLSRGVADLLAAFDFVLFGACSLGSQPDAIQLALSVDGVVLVVDHERTRRDAARRSIDALQAAHARVLGVVFRSRRPSDSGPWRRR
jgi:Mrp family chromosome partitioning ATPase